MAQAPVIGLLEGFANYVLLRAGCQTIPTDLSRLASYLGVKEIEYKDMVSEGYVEAKDDGGFHVAIRADRSNERKRFSLAHELGHVLVHKLDGRPDSALARQYRSFADVSSKLDEESVADYLAGMLLLPSALLSAELPESFTLKTIVKMAARANCSIATSLIRSMWYATHPCLGFHARVSDSSDTAQLLWTRRSRCCSDDLSVKDVLDKSMLAWLGEVVPQMSNREHHVKSKPSSSAQRLQIYVRRFERRTMVFGLVDLAAEFANVQ